MDEFNNKYICPQCDHIGTLRNQPISCSVCENESCSIARHIHGGTRKKWVRVEKEGKSWRWDSTLDKLFKHHAVDSVHSKSIKRSVKRLFSLFSEHNSVIDGLFPHYTVDYERMTGKKSRQRGNRSRQRSTKFGSQRGALYEGVFVQLVDMLDEFERCPNRIKPDNHRFNFHPDGWYLLGSEKIPVEFKTVKSGNFVAGKMNKHVKQSRKHGRRAKKFDYNTNGYSILIVCCPEERIFGSVLLDKTADTII